MLWKMFMNGFPDFANLTNQSLIDELYAKYKSHPESVDGSWRAFFQGVDFSKAPMKQEGSCPVALLIEAYRRYGHLKAKFNPLDNEEREPTELKCELPLDQVVPSYGFAPSQEAPLRDVVAGLEKVYCSRVGFEFMHLPQEMVEWIRGKIEPNLNIDLSQEEKKTILEKLYQSETLETFLHTKYVGKKRFSLEGGETLLPMLSEIVDWGAELGLEQLVIGMAHRGRLNVLANLLKKPYSVIFQEFEDIQLPNDYESVVDVYYHKGFSSDVETRFGKKMHLHLAANSSCLESVDPIVLGVTRSKQAMHQDGSGKKIGAILLHGDAALAGQGVVYESLQFMRLEGYGTGGTIHIAINNQIGFTTIPEEGRSTRYCTDIAKTFSCPIFHVNSEDPESCFFIAKLAIEFRQQFGIDVFIDLNCYRKYGHNEGDEPVFTQPLLYKNIRGRKTILELYKEQLSQNLPDESFKTTLQAALDRARKNEEPHPPEERFGTAWKEFVQPSDQTLFDPFPTKVEAKVLKKVADGFATIPADFHLHPKLQKWVEERKGMLPGKIDWGMGECLAFGSLLLENVPIRLSGQDCRRATFSHRHAVWIDQETGALYFPFAHLAQNQAQLDVYNSPLSEFATLGFEYGYTWANPKALVLWEAQYGDFVIGAQTVIDHYITTAEQKWARYSSLVMLLPHGYEGGGPEHSSGRMERFLQLAALNNTQIGNLTTPAQYFHILRRQALRPIKKPLILFTPKSFLRLAACSSTLKEFTDGTFEEVLDDPTSPKKAKRVLICSGRIYFDLIEQRKTADIAILRIEQLYPLHTQKLEKLLQRYKGCPDFCWIQDEPENMGAWEFLQPHLKAIVPNIRYLGRPRSPVTATGSYKRHVHELQLFLDEAFA